MAATMYPSSSTLSFGGHDMAASMSGTQLQPCHNDWAAPRLQSARPSWTRTDDSTTKAQPPSPGEARTNFGERQAQ